MLTSPLWLRDQEEIPKFKLLITEEEEITVKLKSLSMENEIIKNDDNE